MPPRPRRISALLFLALLSLIAASCGNERPVAGGVSGPGPVIVISIDTLRADHLPVYGAKGLETPHIDALAKDALVFENAYSHVPLTFPSHVTLLSGLLPADAGVRNNLGYRFDSAKHPTIPTLLKAKGYATGAAVSAYVLRGATGLAAAFDDYDDRMDRTADHTTAAMGDVQRSGKETVAAALRWIQGRGEQPFFYMLHLFEPHAPYAPPEPFRSRYAASPYDGEIAASDAYVGELLDGLKASGVYDRATIILVSDHGEGLGDHGEAQHGIFLYREAIHVPLIVKLPGAAKGGKRVAAPVQLTDILPTVAGIAGFDVPPAAKGKSLVAIADGEAPAGRRIFSETMYPRIHLGWSDLVSLVDATHHYIDAPRPELYDIAKDPGEKQNVLADNRRVYASMRAEAQTHDRTLTAPSQVDPEEAAKLAALGYLGSTSSAAAGAKLPDPKDGIQDLARIGEANTLINQNRNAEAVAVLREVLARNASYSDAWTLLAKTLQAMGRSEEALEAYKKTMQVAPMLAPGTALSMAELYLRTGRFDDSIKHAELALSAHPAAARMAIAQAYFAKRDLASAEREGSALLNDPEKQNDAAVLIAQIRIAARRVPEALQLLDEVERRTSASGQTVPPNFWFARGDAVARLNRIADAEQAFNQEIRLYPKNREAYVRLAVLQLLTGREADANRTFAQLLQANPDPSTRTLIEETRRSLRRNG
ncbi:MAG TPA: sulfatase-like hydrolase/transferase [Thermoanaerobaculia bacterium]|nr:sulfatase-like hydrolase/transferase [Thermoanaerobaculia bacterium]